jgi:hypothetical protein
MDLATVLAELVAQQQKVPPIEPAASPEAWRVPVTPSFDVRSLGATPPQYSAGVSMPLGSGELALRGQYQRPGPELPPDWSAMLNYRRPF